MSIYSPDADLAKMFASPRYVLKAGQLVVEEGQLRRAPKGRRLHLRPGFDDAVLRDVRRHFDAYGTVAFDNYAVRHVPDEPVRIAP